MGDSILITIKKLLGLDIDYTPFDQDIIVFINGAMMVLQQLGVGPVRGYTVTGHSQTWSEFLPSDIMLEGVKHYIYLYVKMAFDPPASSVVMDAMKAQRQELEWRLREQAEFYPGDGSRLGYYEQLDTNASSGAESSGTADGTGGTSETTSNVKVLMKDMAEEILQSEAGIVRIVSVREAGEDD